MDKLGSTMKRLTTLKYESSWTQNTLNICNGVVNSIRKKLTYASGASLSVSTFDTCYSTIKSSLTSCRSWVNAVEQLLIEVSGSKDTTKLADSMDARLDRLDGEISRFMSNMRLHRANVSKCKQLTISMINELLCNGSIDIGEIDQQIFIKLALYYCSVTRAEKDLLLNQLNRELLPKLIGMNTQGPWEYALGVSELDNKKSNLDVVNTDYLHARLCYNGEIQMSTYNILFYEMIRQLNGIQGLCDLTKERVPIYAKDRVIPTEVMYTLKGIQFPGDLLVEAGQGMLIVVLGYDQNTYKNHFPYTGVLDTLSSGDMQKLGINIYHKLLMINKDLVHSEGYKYPMIILSVLSDIIREYKKSIQ